MKAYEKLQLDTYMNRENYLKDLNTKEKIESELNYLKNRLLHANDILTQAVLELKLIDVEKLKGELK